MQFAPFVGKSGRGRRSILRYDA